ncbi:hypothetical protein M8C17_15365 [Micromonospora sp. RHAY321]|uniref:hypothetical protein n=1 Tax=Micromonospora sp. RHAY321 TaxID=2944807 RepID=UPI00207D5229|nr:hypothetical protein [Micromonospora sp. RHAY321]MCO1596537.1 hypothetical protein [Micromonospora sp. RHAY321]
MSESAQQRDREVDRPGQANGGADPDVLLDIPKVSVDSIRLAVDGLDADLSLRARLANLLQLDAGVRVHLQGVELDINGVQAEAQLRVRLEQLVEILGRALETIDNNPQIIDSLSRSAGAVIDDVNRSTQQLAAGAAEVTGSARRFGVPDDVRRQAGAAADRLRPGPGRPGAGEQGRAQPTGPEGRPPEGPKPERQVPQGQPPTEPKPEGAKPQGQAPQGQAPQGQAPQGQRPQGQPSEGKPRNEPGASQGPGPSGNGDGGQGGGGVPGGAQAAAQSAAQLAEQAGETLRQAGRSVWEAIQGGMAQHRQQGRRDQ